MTEENPFNSSLATLQHISDIRTDLSLYSVNLNFNAYYLNLFELYKEALAHTDREETKILKNKWISVENKYLVLPEFYGNKPFNIEIWQEMQLIEIWIKKKLTKKRILYDRRKAVDRGDAYRKSLGLKTPKKE